MERALQQYLDLTIHSKIIQRIFIRLKSAIPIQITIDDFESNGVHKLSSISY